MIIHLIASVQSDAEREREAIAIVIAIASCSHIQFIRICIELFGCYWLNKVPDLNRCCCWFRHSFYVRFLTKVHFNFCLSSTPSHFSFSALQTAIIFFFWLEFQIESNRKNLFMNLTTFVAWNWQYLSVEFKQIFFQSWFKQNINFSRYFP